MPAMRGWLWAVVVVMCGAATPAHADDARIRLGGFFGVRAFSGSSGLGTPTSTSLSNSVLFGARASYDWMPWLGFEAELPLVITGTRDDEATVLFLEPRAHVLVERRLNAWLRPFAVLGVGGPVAFSTNRPRFATDILPDGYVGAGVKLDRSSGWSVRADLRVPIVPARGDQRVTPELEVMVSLYRYRDPVVERRRELAEVKDLDSDDDGVLDADDQCLDRAEDRDGFEDEDGCPDIDDDRDEVLDIADKCRTDPETWNGFQDEDGCPDLVPADMAEFDGVLTGVNFRPGSAVMTRGAHAILDRLADALIRYPSVRARIVGHTDSDGNAELNLDLSQRRAEAVKFYLIARGVAEHRLGAVGLGADAPIDEGDDARAKARNRRVEFRIRRRD